MFNRPFSTVLARLGLVAAILATLMILAPAASAAEMYTYEENDDVPVDTFNATDEDGDDIVWGLDGPDKGLFEISTDGVLTFKDKPNFEDPQDDRADNVYKVEVTASGGSIDVEVTVTDVDEPGKPTLTKPQPQVGRGLEAEGPKDPDLPVTDVTWQWAKSMDMETWEDIGNASASGSRNPVDADEGYYLRATAMYTDKHGSGKTASVVSENPVEERTRANAKPNFDDHDDSDAGTEGKQIARSVDENAKGAQVGKPITAKDDDDALLYVLTGAGDEAEDFGINERTGQITTKKALDSNADGADTDADEDTHTVTVTVTDPSGASALVSVVITVNNVNDAPKFPEDDADTANINEAAPTTLYVLEGTGRQLTTDEDVEDNLGGTAYVATDDDAADGPDASPPVPFTYSVDGTDKGSFAIDAAGVLTVEADHDPDYEKQKEYSITLMVEDDEFAMGKVDVTVKVRDAEDAGKVEFNVREPQAGKSVLATLSDQDSSVNNVVWQWARLAETDENAACPLATAGGWATIDGETSASYTPKAGLVTASGDDAGDVNACLRASVTYKDGFVPDDDANDTASMVTERAVQPEDPANTAPEFAKDQDLSTPGDQAVAVRSVAENMKEVDVGAPVVAKDDDLLMYAVDDTTRFSVNNDGQIKTKVELDYEALPEDAKYYMVMLTAMDPSGADDDVMVKIMVTDGPDVAIITGTKAFTYAENDDAPVDTFSATDEDGDDIVWGLDGEDKGDFEISTGGVLTFKDKPNFESPVDERGDNVYKVEVTASGGSIDVEVTVTDVDEPGKPTLTKPQPQVGRGLEAEGPKDPDLPVTDVTWQWAKSMDMETWEDIGNASASGSRNPVDADEGYYLRATAMYTDKHGSGKTASVVSENPVEERTRANAKPNFDDHDDSDAGTEGKQIARSVDENAKGAQVGKPITAKDDDDALLYKLDDGSTATVGTDNSIDETALYKIDERTGQITTKEELDANASDDTDDDEVTHTVRVTVTDPSGASALVSVVITVNNVNDAPVFPTAAPKTLWVNENETDETLRTTDAVTGPEVSGVAYVATDDDAGDTSFTYSVGGADKGSFSISNAGVLTVEADHDPDYEKQKEYSITLMVEDDEFAMGKVDVTVKVRDAEDAGKVEFNVREPQAGKSVLATLSDQDGVVGTVTWQWARQVETSANVCPDAGGGGWDVITGATSANYTPKAGLITVADDDDGDVNACLQVTAMYKDGYDTDSDSNDATIDDGNPSASMVTDRAVQPDDPANTAPEFAKDQDLSTPGDQAVAVRSVAENMKEVDVGAPVVAKDDDLLMYAVDDTTRFSVNNDGQIKTKVELDYEALPEDAKYYMVMLTAMDPSGADDDVMVKIMVTDGPDVAIITANSAPAFDSGTAERMVHENMPEDTAVGDPVTATDADGHTVTYILSGSEYFAIDSAGGQITTTMSLDHEEMVSHTVTVTASDGIGSSDIEVTIAVIDNIGPAFDSDTADRMVEENQGAGTAAGDPVTATDMEGDAIEYSLDSDYFAIDASGQITTTMSLDYEAMASHTVTVTASNDEGSDSIEVTIMVIDNTPPAFAADTAEMMVEESQDAGTAVGDPVTASDVEGDPVTYSMESMYFEIDGEGQITTTVMLDYEAMASHTVTVTGSNGEGSDSIEVTIMVIDNTPPAFASDTAEMMVEESQDAGTAVGDPVTASDVEGDPVTYSMESMYFEIDGEGQITTTMMLDYEAMASHTVTVTASNGEGSDSIEVTIMVIDNTPPAFPAATATRSVEENQDAGTAVGDPVTASDVEGDPVTYSMESMYFEIDGEGQITTTMMLDYEAMASHTVTATASNGEGSDSIEVTIMVIDNPPPAFPSATANRRVDENLYAGAAVGDAFTADDPGDTVTYTLSESMYFEIDENSGQITTTMMLDEEDMSSHMVTVTATDAEGDTDSVSVAITVNDSQPGCDTVGEMGLVNDCEALLDSEDELGGSLNWADDTAMSDWVGVTMSGERVTAVNLRDQGLDGTIPAALGRLSELASLNLRNNADLSGEIPGSLNYLSDLTVLNLHSNSHTGEIPDLSGTSLVELYLPGNELTGSVPAWLNTMTDMTELWLWGNDLSGTLPDLSGMTSLNKLKLNGNTALTGIDAAKLPSSLRWLIIGQTDIGANAPDLSGTSLTTLWMNETGLSGAIPVGGIPTSVTSLNLKDNSLSGAIPDMSGLNNLRYLRLHRNDLSGDIPGTMGDLESLERLWIYENELTGIAAGFGNAVDTLTHLYLDGNSFAEGTCLPGGLAMVENNDFEMAGLEACQ